MRHKLQSTLILADANKNRLYKCVINNRF